MRNSRWIFFMLLVCVSGNIWAQNAVEEGMTFFHGTLEELKKEAKAQKKLVFVDAFTEWCGPCKMMAAQTFKDPKVAEFFNKNFINYKLDMEKGEGPDFARRYGVNMYPTMLFLNFKGEEVYRIVGFRNPTQFMEEGQKATDSKSSYAILNAEYEAGSKDPQLLLDYALTLKGQAKGYQLVAKEYFQTQSEKDLISERNWDAIRQLTEEVDSKEFQVLLKRKAEFVKKYGEKPVNEKIAQVFDLAFRTSIETHDVTLTQNIIQTARKSLGDNERLADTLALQLTVANQDWVAFAKAASAYVSKHKERSAMGLNQLAWAFYEHVTDKADLEKAVMWTKQSVAIDNAYYNNDTMAALLYKLGKYNEALKYANIAIRLAQNTEQEYEETEILLEKIRTAMNAGSN